VEDLTDLVDVRLYFLKLYGDCPIFLPSLQLTIVVESTLYKDNCLGLFNYF